MPVPAQRDPDLTRDILAKWLGDPARLPGARITDLQTPEFSGFSSETLMVDVECGEAAEALAVRVAPLHYKVFPETRFAEEYRLMRILDADTDIPVPPVLWYEPDPGYLGAPFLVMRRIEGRVPTDMPPYHTGGWVTEISPAEREAMWWSGLDILARLHRLDVTALQLSFLDQPRWGKPGLDWEMATFGQAEEDLAWYVYLDRHHSEGMEVPSLEGFPPQDETIARYEELLGRPMLNMGYYEVLSGFKFTVIMSRIAQAMIEWGLLDADSDFPFNNNASRLLDVILEGLPS